MDPKAFFKLSYGVYIVSTSADGKNAGCVINTLTQVTAEPARLSIALNKNNETLKLIEISGTFSAVVLSDDVTMDQIKRFGFQSSRDANKFDGIPHGRRLRPLCLPRGLHPGRGNPRNRGGRGDRGGGPGYERSGSYLLQLPSQEKRRHTSERSLLPEGRGHGSGLPLQGLRLYFRVRHPAPGFHLPGVRQGCQLLRKALIRRNRKTRHQKTAAASYFSEAAAVLRQFLSLVASPFPLTGIASPR